MRSFRLILSGVLIGITNIIPGVSGGTMAVLLGLYDAIIKETNSFLQKDSLLLLFKNPQTFFSTFRQSIQFLGLLAIGGLVGIKGFAFVIEWLLTAYLLETLFLFLGLIIGSIPSILSIHKASSSLGSRYIQGAIFGIVCMLAVNFLPEHNSESLLNLSFFGFLIYMFISGMIASGTMIIPGISGSLMLMILGSYFPILTAINDVNLLILSFVGLGAVVGLIIFTKGIKACLGSFPDFTHGAILGLVLGSIIELFPGISFDLTGLYSISFAGMGIGIALLFSVE